MSFTGNEDHSITLTDAATMTAAYRSAHPTWAKGHYFGKAAIKAIFDQSGCVGMRVYYGHDGSGVQELIIVGVNSSENDLYTGLLADRSVLCPTRCGSNNALNTSS